MQYSHDSRHLFYTDSLHNSIQSYSISENRVVDAAKSHPSPITAFAVSCDSNLILSTSANPPTVQICNQMLATTISLVPSASSAPVVSCAFHPSRKQLFLLAFGNGVLAAFDYAKLPITKNQNKKENARFVVIQCHARGIHAFRHLHDPNIAGSSGITGAGFVPGQRSRAVTVGEDGRCFLVDFEKGDTIGSWHIGAPATGLTIREIAAGPNNRKEELGGYLIGVGTVNGKCLVYDGNGNKIAERVIDAEAESVLDVEWVSGSVLSPRAAIERCQVFGDVSLPEGDMLSPPNPVSAGSSPRKLSSGERSLKANRSRIRSEKPVSPLSVQDPNPAALLPTTVEGDDGDSPIAKNEPVRLRRRHRVFSPPIYDSLEETADQSYMKLFSPVKRRRAFKSASLPEKKSDNSNKSSDPRVRATQGSDHRSAISAPLLWEDKVPEDEIVNEGQKEARAAATAEDGFGAFQTDTQRETTTAEATNSHSNNESVFEGLSSVPGEQVKVEERIEDGRILSEIRSVRAMFSGKSKSSSGNLPLLAPYLPKARSTPVNRVGPAPTEDSSIKRAASAPAGKIYPSDLNVSMESAQESDNQSVAATARNGFEETESKEKGEMQQPHRDGQEDIPTEEDEDIWLAQTVSSRASRSNRKRKKAAVEDETTTPNVFPDTGINLSRSTSMTRSSKSRKTVSWSDEPHPPIDILPTPIGSSSVIAEWGDGDVSASSHSYLGSTRPLSISSHHRINSTRFVATKPTDIALESKKDTSQNSDQTIEQIVKMALANMQAAMSQQMSAMQTEMQRQFRGQNREFQKLRDEMGRVREENQKLRSMLFKSSGIRDSVRKSGGPSSTPR